MKQLVFAESRRHICRERNQDIQAALVQIPREREEIRLL